MSNGKGPVMSGLQPAGDIGSAVSVIASALGYLPSVLTVIATVCAIIWYTIMIWDWISARRLKRAEQAAKSVLAEAARTAAVLVKTPEK
jgi:hypothetical protein